MAAILSPLMRTHLTAAAFGLVSSVQSLRAPQCQKLGRQQVNCFPVLVEHRNSHGDDALMRLGPRRRDFNNFTFDVQDVIGAGRPGPGDLSAETNDPVRKWQTTIDEKPHSDCSRVPAARSQSFEDARLSHAFVEMKRLRVELRGERFDLSFFNDVSAGREPPADLQIVQVEPCAVLMRPMPFSYHATATSVSRYLIRRDWTV